MNLLENHLIKHNRVGMLKKLKEKGKVESFFLDLNTMPVCNLTQEAEHNNNHSINKYNNFYGLGNSVDVEQQSAKRFRPVSGTLKLKKHKYQL